MTKPIPGRTPARARVARFLFLMLDGVGAGELPDAAAFGDAGADTLGNLSLLVDLDLPNLRTLGLGNLHPLRGVPPVLRPLALPGRLTELSAGKDTTNGHWEHMGVVTEQPFPTYPDGFPEDVLGPFRERIGLDVLGNKAASGTEIIAELGGEHVATGKPIVYTSADSVFQIACHVEAIPLEELYRYCTIAREILGGRHAVARVIARPFTGRSGAFVRTADRKDFSLAPPSPTYLDLLSERGVPVTGVGKIHQIFAGRGITEEIKVASNDENLAMVSDLLASGREGLIFTNLVDFDMAWGHRNDVEGFAAGLAAVDRALPAILDLLAPGDRLLVTADHGVDPTTVGTDHTREYVPLLYYPRPRRAPEAAYEGYMSDTGATVFAHLTGEPPTLAGRPFDRLNPAKGWRSYPGMAAARPDRPSRVRAPDAAEAAAFLRSRLGEAPRVAVILGSGLDAVADILDGAGQGAPAARAGLDYEQIPHWRCVSVPGHTGRLDVRGEAGDQVVFLRGRIHGYEGADVGEIELPVRTLARWGVRHLILTNASGGLRPDTRVGGVAVVTRVLDCQSPFADGSPRVLPATSAALVEALRCAPAGSEKERATGIAQVAYVAVPGPHYETAAEVGVLGALGGDVVGMSTAAELQAAADEGLETAVLTVITNMAGATAESVEASTAVHQQVLDASKSSAPRVSELIQALLAHWHRG